MLRESKLIAYVSMATIPVSMIEKLDGYMALLSFTVPWVVYFVYVMLEPEIGEPD